MGSRLLIVLLLALPITIARAEPGRVALVIGNAAYQSLQPLANPGADARAVADKLSRIGFTLIGADGRPTQGPVLDLGSDAFPRVIAHFADAAQGAEIAFVYYAGHGMQIAGNPYLLPVDVPLVDLARIEERSQALESILNALDGRVQVTLAVFDACREIPELGPVVAAAMRGTGVKAEAYRGLGRIQPGGSPRIVAYSAAAGRLAADGSGAHSPYTEALLAELDRPDQEVGDLFRQAAARVGRDGQRPEVLIQGVAPNQFFLARPESATDSTSQQTTPPAGAGGLLSTLTIKAPTPGAPRPQPGLSLSATKDDQPHVIHETNGTR